MLEDRNNDWLADEMRREGYEINNSNYQEVRPDDIAESITLAELLHRQMCESNMKDKNREVNKDNNHIPDKMTQYIATFVAIVIVIVVAVITIALRFYGV